MFRGFGVSGSGFEAFADIGMKQAQESYILTPPPNQKTLTLSP